MRFGPPPPKMICYHSPGDPNCSSTQDKYRTYEKPKEEPRLDARKFEILEAEQVGKFFAIRVKYPSCPRCEFEGIKVIVYKDVTSFDALKWKEIDPHFRDPGLKSLKTSAPSPIARFPGSDSGWEWALKYMQHLAQME